MQNIHPVKISKTFRKEIEIVIKSWKNFVKSSINQKEKFEFEEDQYGDAGYEIKTASSNTDYKENFHINLHQYPRLVQIRDLNIPCFPTTEFIDNIPNIIRKLEPIIINYVTQIERDTNTVGLTQEVISSRPYWIIRYLHYFNQTERGHDMPLAKAHIDKHGFTIHLYESEPGLEILTPEEPRSWVPVEGSHHIMNGAQMQLRTRNKKKAITHRVIRNRSCESRSRYAMVCFIPLIETRFYNKSKYGNMQSHEPGFNYDVTIDQFGNYFSQPTNADT
jgi:isopenicillin N synthase-like dioxygenase